MSNSCFVSSKNRSKTSDGHTMSKIDVQNELAKQERELLRSYKGYEVSCGRCAEKFSISTNDYVRADKIALERHLVQGNCPACTKWKTDMWHATRNHLLEISFEIDGKEIKALRVPTNYRPKGTIKIDPSGLHKA